MNFMLIFLSLCNFEYSCAHEIKFFETYQACAKEQVSFTGYNTQCINIENANFLRGGK